MTDSTTARPVLNGRYELHRRLARGGMADVFLAHDQLLDRPVAVKVLFPQFASEPLFVERFRREAQAAANLNHPSIVAVYDWGEYDRTYFIVMEYVEGRSLAELLRGEGVLHPDRAAEIAIDTAAALGFAHRNGTIHRDVKPGNILITPGGQVKVTDFGIARAFGGGDDLTQTGSVMGTATYFSPEQAQGKQVDPRSDLYSLGVVMFEMVAGRAPFDGDTPVTIAYKHVQDVAPKASLYNPDVPPGYEAIVDRLLAKDPSQRYASAEELRSALRRMTDNPPPAIIPDRTSPAEREHRPSPVVAQAPMAHATSALPAAVVSYERSIAPAPARSDYVEPPRRNGLFLLALVLMLLGVGAIAAYIYVNFGDGEETATTTVEVPTLINRNQTEAVALLEDVGLQADPILVDAPDGVAPGIVVAQEPAPRSPLEEGGVVVIEVARSSQQVLLTDVAGYTLDEATRLLEDAGFAVDFTIQPSSDIPEGVVIRSNPPAGQEYDRGSDVDLIVSSGPDQVEVPEVATMTVIEATYELGRAGLPNPTLAYEASDTVEEGRVIATDPAAGQPVSIDRAILMIVSTGPEQAIVPPVVGMDQASAQAALSAAEFVPFVDTRDVADGSPDAGMVLAQDPAPNTSLETGSTVRIVVGVARAPEPEPEQPPDTEPPPAEGEGGG